MLVDARSRKDYEVQPLATKIEKIAVQVCGDGIWRKIQFFPIQPTIDALAVPGRFDIPLFLPRDPQPKSPVGGELSGLLVASTRANEFYGLLGTDFSLPE